MHSFDIVLKPMNVRHAMRPFKCYSLEIPASLTELFRHISLFSEKKNFALRLSFSEVQAIFFHIEKAIFTALFPLLQ